MTTKTTGAEFKRYYLDDAYWHDGMWHEDEEIEEDPKNLIPTPSLHYNPIGQVPVAPVPSSFGA